MKILYTAHATATGEGRAGATGLDDGQFSTPLSIPEGLGGSGGGGLNPEQLFAMGYAACYLGALKAVAKREKLSLGADTKVQASVGIGPRPDGQGFGLSITLNITLPGVDAQQKQELSRAAHGVCPYSHALSQGVDVVTCLF
jgi:Ohr subfamily peroxiredoxin